MTKLKTLVLAAWLSCAAPFPSAQNVDLSTIPPRDTVQLTIYNSEDLTLVRETRHITFAPGLNAIQFSWADTLIDPSSVDLRFRTHGDAIDILDTTFPHDRPQMLSWNVDSRHDGDAVVEISYFTSGITWSADYACIVGRDGHTMSFDGFVRIDNQSGEDYEDAQVRLVVGTINLVEKVAELARRGMISREDADGYARRQRKVAEFPAAARSELAGALAADMALAEAAPKEIIKEGLSEYFIYAIEGAETVRHTWSKRMRLFQGADVPFDIEYRYRSAEYGEQLVRLYILRNDEASGLGSTPLPDGTVRLFGDNGRDGLSFLVATPTRYVPIGQEIELNLGVDPQVVHERVRLADWRDNFWFRDVRGQKLFSPADGPQIRHDFPVAGWDDHQRWTDRIRNHRGEPIDVEIRLTLPGHVIFTSDLEPVLHDYRSPQFRATVPAGHATDLAYTVTSKQGINRTQDNVTLER